MKIRRAKGTGHITKIGKVYYGVIKIQGKVKKIRLDTNERRAQSLWSDWLAEHITDLKRDVVRHNINESWAKVYEALIVRGRSSSTIKMYKSHYNTFKSYCETRSIKYLEDLTRADIADLLNKSYEGRSTATKNYAIVTLRKIFKENITNFRLEESCLKDLQCQHGSTVSRQALNSDEILALKEAALKMNYGQEWQALVYIALYTGLRLTDCVHLMRSKIKDDIMTIVPKKTETKVGSIVTIPVHEDLKKILEALPNNNNYYLPNLVELYDNKQANFSSKIRRLFKLAKINTTEEVLGRTRRASVKSFHCLRATFITRLAESNVSQSIIQSLAGHISPIQTQVYTHPNMDVKRAAIETINLTNKGKVFVHPVLKKVLEEAKEQIRSTITTLLDQGEKPIDGDDENIPEDVFEFFNLIKPELSEGR